MITRKALKNQLKRAASESHKVYIYDVRHS